MGKRGLYILSVGGKNKLMFNEREISATGHNGIDSMLGVYVSNGELIVNGESIAKASSDDDIIEKDNKLFLGNVDLELSGACINITMADYNTLLGGGLVSGYKRYSESQIYNIVDNVANAPTITYTIANGVITFSDGTTALKLGNNLVYNNSAGTLTENVIDSDETILNMRCPFVSVRYFDPIVPINGTISIDYYVDTQDMESLRYGRKNDTFTVIVKDASGIVLGKKTTYAGNFIITTPAFTTAGETWISVECIDSNGVGSVVQFFDIWVKAPEVITYYEMKEADLETYGITVDDDSLEPAYANKAALTNFFADVKSGEIDGSSGYNGVKMLNSIYYVDYHARVSNDSILGTQTYRRAKVDLSTKKIISVDSTNTSEEDVVASGVMRTIRVYDSEFDVVGDDFAGESENMSKWEELGSFLTIDNDKYAYLVYNTSIYGDRNAFNVSPRSEFINFPNHFTVDLNGATIKASQTTDIRGGCVVNLGNNIDTHIVNGNIVGNYENFDFLMASIREGTSHPAELQSVIGTYNSRYCSFEDLDISYPTGYDCAVAGSTSDNGASFKNNVSASNNYTRIDLSDPNGSIIDSSQETNSEFITTNAITISGAEEVRTGCWGYAGYGMGKKREIFYSFYDSNGDYIKSIKSKFYYPCKVPTGATSVKVTAYGLYDKFSNADKLEVWFGGIKLSRNIVVKDCHWHDTRTCALSASNVRGFLVDNCTFTDCVTCPQRYMFHYFVVDFEDGWQNMANVMIRNCTLNRGIGSEHFLVYFCEGFNFIDNDGWRLQNNGGIESGFFEGNTFTIINHAINYMSPHSFLVFRNNTIDELRISYNPSTKDVVNENTVLPELEMEDTTIKNRCSYSWLKLRNSMNGDIWND